MALAKVGKLFFFLGLALIGVGLLFLVVFYASGGSLPIPGFESWNLLIGLLLMALSFPVWVVGLILWLVGRRRASTAF